jgi:hypothetical protein
MLLIGKQELKEIVQLLVETFRKTPKNQQLLKYEAKTYQFNNSPQ